MQKIYIRFESKPVVGMVANWLLIVFTAAVLIFFIWNADPSDVILSSFVLVPWIVGLAALAALLVARAWSITEAWSFIGLEVAAIASTVGLWIVLLLFRSGHASSENGIALILFPIVQFAVLLAYFFGVQMIAHFFKRNLSAQV